ncbi:hypothetical protein K490DRAFT_69859 [Saccharata proteae CBS 121410]|uniref:DUF6036 domain-containing protein n=1 Tax=Saccharata proteae CBS 121410 TaxID=1314787 RepID=A0A9P4LTU8_9PEZI|nr:hypothetical protein K490DRAFT_69859 [Saccharata proteae CBS 121410]
MSTRITPSLHAAILSAFQAAATLLPNNLRPQFVLVGGAALLHYGGTRPTEDIDIVGSAEAHWEFLEAARRDAHFSVLMDGGLLLFWLLSSIDFSTTHTTTNNESDGSGRRNEARTDFDLRNDTALANYNSISHLQAFFSFSITTLGLLLQPDKLF